MTKNADCTKYEEKKGGQNSRRNDFFVGIIKSEYSRITKRGALLLAASGNWTIAEKGSSKEKSLKTEFQVFLNGGNFGWNFEAF